MFTILAVVQVLVSVVLIVIVLMQSQQSMNLSGMFGGASQSALGSKPQSVLSKATTVLAIVFMAFSLVFSFLPRSQESPLSPGNVPASQSGQAPGTGSPAGPGGGADNPGGNQTPQPSPGGASPTPSQ
jgi:preprotein translocase subunit SecG